MCNSGNLGVSNYSDVVTAGTPTDGAVTDGTITEGAITDRTITDGTITYGTVTPTGAAHLYVNGVALS